MNGALFAAFASACAPAPTPESPPPSNSTPALAPAPWSAAPLSSSAVPSVYAQQWNRAENRASCRLIAPQRLGADVQQAVPRAATFSGGWGVAYDLPETRSAFGVAGSGASAWDPGVYDAWPYRRTFADSSRVGYGPEGGQGPNLLAYVRIPGQECLYNVWSRRGREHLEELLGQLRFITPM